MNLYRAPALLLLGTLLATVALGGCDSSEKSTSTTVSQTPLTVEDSVDITVTAKVKAVDYATRVMTLADAQGHEITVVVDNSVQRLNEVKVGDDVKARYSASLLAELRAPTADELAHPITAVSFAGRASRSNDPSAGVVQAMRVVTTVEAVDVPNMRVTLRGPMGDVEVVRGRKRENLERLRVGDTIVITFSESLVLSLEKIAPR